MRGLTPFPAPSLADAEGPEDAIEQVLGGRGARDRVQGTGGAAQVLGEQVEREPGP